MTRGDVLWSRPGGLLNAQLHVERDNPFPEVVLRISGATGSHSSDVHLSRREAQALADALAAWLAQPASGRYVMHYTGQHERGTGGEWTVYRREADPYPSYGPGEFTGLHQECAQWIAAHDQADQR